MTPIAPPAPALILHLLVQLSALLLVGLLLGRIAARFKLPAIVGELLAGVVLGPSLLGHLNSGAYFWLFPANAEQMHLLDAVGQFGVLLLVGVAGAHLDSRLLRRRGTTAVSVSAGGLLITLALGVGLGLLAPGRFLPEGTDRVTFALFLAVAVSVTAIPVIAKTLADLKLLHRDIGQLTMTAGMIDDAVAWFLLSVVSALATAGLRGGTVALSVLYLCGFVVAAGLVGRPLVRAALRLAGRSDEDGPTITTVVVVVLSGATITHALGMEAVFGAFVAGILIGAPGVVEARRLAPLRTVVLTVLAPIFLATAGLRADFTVLADPQVVLAAVILLAVATLGKFAGAYLGARATRLSHWEGLALGAGMNSRGVVEIIVAMAGLRLGILDVTSYTLVALLAIVTSLMAPPLLRLAMSRVTASADEQLRLADQEQWSTTGSPAPSAMTTNADPVR